MYTIIAYDISPHVQPKLLTALRHAYPRAGPCRNAALHEML